MKFLRAAAVFLVLVDFMLRPAGAPAESPGDDPTPKPSASSAAGDANAQSSPAVPAPGEGRGAKKKSAGKPFRPSIDVPAGDAVSFPVDI